MGRRLRFRGEHRLKVDAKGRMSIPASFRRVLETGDPDWNPESKEHANPTLVMVYGNSRLPYLECYTVEEMDRIEARIDAMKAGDRKKALTKVFSAGSEYATVDETGRIVLPARFRKRYDITGDAWAVADLNRFQIWSDDRYVPTADMDVDLTDDELPEDMLEWLDEEEA